MIAGSVLAIVLGTMLALLLALAAAITLAKGIRELRARRRHRIETELRPRLLDLIGGEGTTASDFDGLSRYEGRVLESLAVQFLPKIRGEASAAVVDLLEARGAIEAARRRTRRMGAVGRARAAEFLGSARSARALPEVIRLLDDRIFEVRIVAARALGQLGDSTAIPDLLAALDAPRPLPAGPVAMSLLRLGRAGGAQQVCAGLRGRLPATRAVAAEVVGKLGVLEAVDDVIKLLDREEVPEVRVAAARALGEIGSARACGPLVSCLEEDLTTAVRAEAAEALGQIGVEDEIRALRAALGRPDHRVQVAAANGLVAIGSRGTAALEAEAGGERGAAAYAHRALALDALARADRFSRAR
ncbi:MAG: HEAT repeat domain-containing protein [Actinomycetota bacterium]